MQALKFKLTTTSLLIMCSFSTVMAQNIFTFAGAGTFGYSGDGSAATGAQLSSPVSVAIDALGNIYIADFSDNRIRKVNTSGVISTFAGTGVGGNSGDGGPAINAQLYNPSGVAVDAAGNVYITDNGNNKIRKVNTAGIISTFAGTGFHGYGGDGGAATNASLTSPSGIAVDALGNVYFSTSDFSNYHFIRKVNTSGIISTFAGSGLPGFSGDGGLAINALLYNPYGITFDASGNMYFCDSYNYRIRKINLAGVISTFAGTGFSGFNGDGGPAINAQLGETKGVSIDASGNIYISDYMNHRVRKINTSGVISTLAGTGFSGGYSGDGGAAITARLFNPSGIAVDGSGNVFIADVANFRVREICVGACLAGINSFSTQNNEIFIFPNPNNGSFKIQIDGDVKSGQLILLNSLGQYIFEQKIIQGANDIKTIQLPIGLYSYILQQDNQTIKTGKLAIEQKTTPNSN